MTTKTSDDARSRFVAAEIAFRLNSSPHSAAALLGAATLAHRAGDIGNILFQRTAEDVGAFLAGLPLAEPESVDDYERSALAHNWQPIVENGERRWLQVSPRWAEGSFVAYDAKAACETEGLLKADGSFKRPRNPAAAARTAP